MATIWIQAFDDDGRVVDYAEVELPDGGTVNVGRDSDVIETFPSDDGHDRDDALATWGAVKKLAEHTVETHETIDERIEDLERRMDRAERDIDVIDGAGPVGVHTP